MSVMIIGDCVLEESYSIFGLKAIKADNKSDQSASVIAKSQFLGYFLILPEISKAIGIQS